jgi:acyl carrier protein
MPNRITELRELILKAAPDQSVAQPVLNCEVDEPLDKVIPFSSVIVLGVIIALEDKYRIKISQDSLKHVSEGGISLSKIAAMISEMESEPL